MSGAWLVLLSLALASSNTSAIHHGHTRVGHRAHVKEAVAETGSIETLLHNLEGDLAAVERNALEEDEAVYDANPANWMADVDNDTPIWKLSVPGTHDSLTYSGIHSEHPARHYFRDDGVPQPHFALTPLPFTTKHTLTQTLDVQEQLNLGIRAFDFRLYHDFSGNVHSAHGPKQLNVDFGPAIQAVDAWLVAHAEEVVFIGIKLEYIGIANGANLVTRIIETLDNLARAPGPGQINVYDQFGEVGVASPGTHMEDLRGKVVFTCYTGVKRTDDDIQENTGKVFNDCPMDTHAAGVAFANAGYNWLDPKANFFADPVEQNSHKIPAIALDTGEAADADEAAILKADEAAEFNTTHIGDMAMKINMLSATGINSAIGAIAGSDSGTYAGEIANNVNDRHADHLDTNPGMAPVAGRSLGFVLTDFPEDSLVNRIIGYNFPQMTGNSPSHIPRVLAHP